MEPATQSQLEWRNITPDGAGRADEGVCSLLLLNPATFWFGADSLKELRVRILILTGENDQIAPPAHAQTVIDGVSNPGSVRHQMIPGAGHFSFMSKFPSQLVRPEFPPSQDPPGFDREEFQPALFACAGDFFKLALR